MAQLLKDWEEAKKKGSEEFLVEKKSPLIILGSTLNKRFFGSFNITSSIKKIIPTSIILDIKRFANSEITPFIGMKSIDTNTLNNSSCLVLLNIDNINLRKIISNFNNKIVWVNSHGSEVAIKADILIPVVTAFESESIYVNFEQRYQKTLKTFPSVGESRELKKIIKALYSETVNFKPNKSATFIEEVINNPEKFKTIQNIFLTQE